MRRGPACLVAGTLLVLSAAACTDGNANEGPGKNTASPVSVIGTPQAASLALQAGRSSAQYKITAPDPARYDFDVTVTAPASVDVGVSIRTWYGAIFPSILVSTHQPDACRLRGSQDVCSELFPLLPAQQAGSWTVIAAKQSGPAATVRIVITFARVTALRCGPDHDAGTGAAESPARRQARRAVHGTRMAGPARPGADHDAGCHGQTRPGGRTNGEERLTARVALAFFDRYVLGQADALAAMTRDANVTGTAAQVSGGQPPP